MNYEENIGRKVWKYKSGKPFKSGLKENTVKGVINHSILTIPAYTFEEDDSYVECRRCEVILTKKEILANFCTEIAKQEDCPQEFIEIVNKNFWDLLM